MLQFEGGQVDEEYIDDEFEEQENNDMHRVQ